MTAVVAAAALGMGLMGSDGDSDSAREPALASVPTGAPNEPDAQRTNPAPDEPEISAKPVTAAPEQSGEVTAPASPSSTRTPPAAPAPASPAPTPPPPPEQEQRPAPRAVPNVVGLTVGEAAARLAASGYSYEVVCQDSGRPTGRVASQQPAAGQQWTIGGRVALFVPDWRCRGGRPGPPWGDDD